MKFSTLIPGLFLLTIFVFPACSSEELIEPSTPLIELQFSSPPIDLQGLDVAFAADVPYDQYDKTKFDVFLPASSDPTGLVIFIHGGGFRAGDKDWIYEGDFPADVRELLSQKIAVATLNYRLLDRNETEGVLKCLNDSKRGLQYIRYIHKELNINKEDIVLFGGSAGGGTSLWLASHDEMQDINHADPVLRESTRVKAAALNGTQSSYDIENRWVNDVFVDFGISWEDMKATSDESRFLQFYGVSSWAAYEAPEMDTYRQEVDMLGWLTSDDPELWINNTGPLNTIPQSDSDFNHHPFHAREIKAYADAAGVPNVTTYGKPILVQDPSNESYVDFLLRKLGE